MSARNEFEREFFEGGEWTPPGGWQFDRRDFLRLFGGGIFVGLASGPALAQESGRSFGGHPLPKDVGAWLHIAADGGVKVFTGKVEGGQNIRTSLAQQVAEELRAPFDTIEMVMGDTALTPYDMGTFGSRSTPTMGPQLRTMAAAARQMLIESAAARWGVDEATLVAADGKVTDPKTKRSLSYGEITRGENLVKVVSSDEALTPASDWKIAGTAVPKAHGRDFVTGKHVYPSDVVRPGMLFGAVLRPDGFNAKLKSIDTSAAEKLPGVKVVRDGDFTGAVAADRITAQHAAKAIKANWEVPGQPGNKDLFDVLKSGSGNDGEARPQHVAGSVAQAMDGADIKLEEQYTVQYIAHAPLEPRAAVAEWNGDKLTVWTGTQRPFGVRDELVQAFGIPEENVRVIQPDMGSGYGGKHTGEAALEAARLARAAGKPVKLEWTRREEFTWAYFRPAGVIEIRAGARRDGELVAWEHHNYNSGNAGIGTPYNVANQIIQYHPVESPLRQGSYRSLAAAANHFARESAMDSLAHQAAMDPLEFRIKNLSDPRLIAVFRAAAERFGWGRVKSTSERGFGIAGGTEKGGYVATCAEVAIDPTTRQVRIRRVVQAWESGAIVNPDGLRNQVSGAIVQGIGGALFEQILFADGRIQNAAFAQYRLPRFSDVPQIEVVLLDRKDLPSAGAGETGIVGLAPAVGNAMFAATGVRPRGLPMAPRTAAPGQPEPRLRS
ncbi:MAG: molybdopterin cofactor-binding domain-containing protein [Terracidiphilus sp.]|jgi:isoquinoline 1-oxidoreductase